MNKTNVFLLICNLVVAVLFAKGYSDNKEKEQAFNECIEDVTNKCRSVISYAVMLETANHKLNKRVKECNEGR